LRVNGCAEANGEQRGCDRQRGKMTHDGPACISDDSEDAHQCTETA
jgi:hypothetical protein